MRWVFCAVFLLTSVCPLQAAGYDDFATAMNANVRKDSKQAIMSFTAALAANDLVPIYVAMARRGRAAAYLAEGRCKEAKADLDVYAAQKPLDRSGHLMLAQVQLCLEDDAGAQQSFATAMAVYQDGVSYWHFGREQWARGLFADADTSLLQGAKLIEKEHSRRAYYVVLWYAMTADRIGKLDRNALDDMVDHLIGSDWPKPLLKLYLGTMKPDEVAAMALRGVDAVIPGQKCEADFYTAEWHIARGNIAAAKLLIVSAVAHCPKAFMELGAARIEAGRLGVVPVPKE